jgi:hypothetical protein
MLLSIVAHLTNSRRNTSLLLYKLCTIKSMSLLTCQAQTVAHHAIFHNTTIGGNYHEPPRKKNPFFLPQPDTRTSRQVAHQKNRPPQRSIRIASQQGSPPPV